jgi:hypothetical protein
MRGRYRGGEMARIGVKLELTFVDLNDAPVCTLVDVMDVDKHSYEHEMVTEALKRLAAINRQGNDYKYHNEW